jgi:hypothetical protein
MSVIASGRAAFAALLFLVPITARAQASAYVPLDDVAYTYVNALMARGLFRELSGLERPYTERALVSAIDSARAQEPSAVMTTYLDALYKSIEKYAIRPGNSDTLVAQTFRARFTGDAYATSQTSGERELMLADQKSSHLRPGGSIRLVMGAGPVVGFVRTIIDSRLNVDPEFAGRKDRKLAARTEDGYVSGQWKYGELSFGRVGRNWGPPTESGLQLGNYAYTYDHLYGVIGTDKIHFATLVARLDNLQLPSGELDQRYFAIHRLSLRRGRWELAGSESYLFTGVGRGFEPSFANPFNIFGLSWRNENQAGNLGLGVDLGYRSRLGTLAGQLFIDDLQIDKCNPNCHEPSSYGLTLTAEGLPLLGDQRWFASYTRVSNLAYRTPTPAETYDVFGVGLGRGFSDYDEARIGADLAVLPRTPLRFYVAHRRQGQGDYREPYPTPAEYATTPGIFSGIVTGVTRAGLSGGSRWRDFEATGDIGINHITNDLHILGSTRTAFEGRVKIAIEPRWSLSF